MFLMIYVLRPSAKSMVAALHMCCLEWLSQSDISHFPSTRCNEENATLFLGFYVLYYYFVAG